MNKLMSTNFVAEVIPLKINLDHGFYYYIPHSLQQEAEVGKRVLVPFRNKKRVGIIIKIISEIEMPEIKEIEEVLDPIPILSTAVLSLADWMASYYFCSRGSAISSIIPSKISQTSITTYFEKLTVQDNNLFREEFFNPGEIKGKKNKTNKPILFHYHSYRERDLYYYQLITRTVKQGKQVLLLIPDQYSYKKLKDKLANTFGESLLLFDKNVNQTLKYLRFVSTKRVDVKVVIGTRSSIFLPFSNLGLIIVEEEDSPLYKEERSPHYHAREVALARSSIEDVCVVLGSGAPSMDSYRRGINKEFIVKSRPNQHFQKKSKYFDIDIIDLEIEKSFQRIISFPLQQKIAGCLRLKKGVVLFLNRRGFASYIICKQCGLAVKCKDCNTLLSYYRKGSTGYQYCPVCKKREIFNKHCPSCGEQSLKPVGFGTQYVEDIVRRMFPRAVIQRFDKDLVPTIREQQKILKQFKEGEINILIGTQLLFGKLDYKKVDLVGIILIDHLFNIPYYRSAENAFQFISQIALNLQEEKNSKMLLIQTCQPEHHSLQALKELNYQLFYEQELIFREELGYPPITRLVKIDFSGVEGEQVKKSATEFREFIYKSGLLKIMNNDIYFNDDNLHFIKEKDKKRICFLIRMKNKENNHKQLSKILLPYILKYKNKKVKMAIDVEPLKLN